MSLTPEQIKAMNEMTGLNKPTTPAVAATKTRADEIRQLGQSATQDAVVQKEKAGLITTKPELPPGADNALISANPAGKTGIGALDTAKMVPNAAKDAVDLAKESTYGTAKRILYDIPKEAMNIIGEQGVGEAIKNTILSAPEALVKTVWGLVPQSAKELANTNALSKIPEQFKQLAEQNGGSYAVAFKKMVDAIPDSVTPALKDYADQIDRARQSFENHPLNELLGYVGLKEMMNNPGSVKEGLKTTKDFIKSPVESLKGAYKDVPVDKFVSAVKSVIPDKSSLRSSLTNTDPQIFKRLESPEHATKVKDYLGALDENRNPYADLAYKVGENITNLEKKAGTTFGEQARTFTEQGVKLDVGTRMKQIGSAVQEFSPGFDIKFEQLRAKDGKLSGYKLTKGQYSPFGGNEIGYINSMIRDITSARSVTADEVLALDKKLGRYYNLVDDTHGATPYHALVMKIKATSEAMIAESLPPELRGAYKEYARIQDMKSEFGDKIVDDQGTPKDSAASFLGNLMGKNKEIIQNKVKGYSDILGTDITKETQAISDANKLHLTQAPTGGRISDVLKSTLFTGAGATLGAMTPVPGGPIVGAMAGAEFGRRVTSPRNAGNAAINETLSPKLPKGGMSVGDVTKNIHPEDQGIMKDFIDAARIDKHIPDSVYSMAEKLAERFGISMDKGLKGVASEFEKILNGLKSKKSKKK